ncbi:hypothetical protein OHB06_49350 [Streptomyces sp. NBC_01604]|uniref:hypothetical protein n=1 Tax=Streptomyces sp. NBC_01604 TaxID=2975894 RepID=UPI00386A8915
MRHLLDATAPAVLLITEPRNTGLSTSWTAVWRLRGFGCGCAPEHVPPVDGVDYDQVVTDRLEKTPQCWATATVDRTTRPGVWLSCGTCAGIEPVAPDKHRAGGVAAAR